MMKQTTRFEFEVKKYERCLLAESETISSNSHNNKRCRRSYLGVSLVTSSSRSIVNQRGHQRFGTVTLFGALAERIYELCTDQVVSMS